MAEERLIDADKDKRYRIKVNADGEEELVVEDGEEPAPAEEEVTFDAPEYADSGDDEALLTPEQLKEKREAEERELAELKRRVDELLQSAKADCAAFRYATALEYLEKAEELDGENGQLHALKLRAYTRDFTDYSQIVTAAEFAGDLEKFVSAEDKEKLLKAGAPSLESNVATLRGEVSAMNKENEEKKAERAVRFVKDRNTSLIAFGCVFAVFAVFLGLAIYFTTVIYTVSTGKYLILTCVFGALAFIALIALAVAARFVNITCRRVRLNKRNTSTQLGRDLLAKQATLKAFLAVYNALKG